MMPFSPSLMQRAVSHCCDNLRLVCSSPHVAAGPNGVQSPCFYLISAERGSKKGKVFTVHVTKAYRGSRGIAPLILNFGAR